MLLNLFWINSINPLEHNNLTAGDMLCHPLEQVCDPIEFWNSSLQITGLHNKLILGMELLFVSTNTNMLDDKIII